MKRLVCITGIILISCLFTGMLFAPSSSAEIQNTVESSTVSGVQDEIFVLKSENNRIVVYKKGENSPYITTDTLTDSLPKGDVMRLKEGIEVKGKAQLRKSLEDYCS